tara:strand:+ start:994 stop:1257 length:264 start_codon:yes stop_codon:yes gene_type:complete
MNDLVVLIETFGFEVVMIVGLGYFVYYVWTTITNVVDPAIDNMKKTVIRLIDQLRLLDQDMIRLQKKVEVIMQMKENEKKKQHKGQD